MSLGTRYRSSASLLFPSFPPGVKWLISANVAVYILQLLFVDSTLFGKPILLWLNLMPYDVLRHGEIWQLVTYMFLHAGIGHILFNMLTLWMFGAAVEQTWGTRRFLQFYFICGFGAGVCVVIANRLFGNIYQPTIGASGAIYGVLLAFGMLFPDTEILLMFLFPIKAKFAVMIFGAIAFLSSLQGGGTVSNFAHLGGMLVGYLYIKQQFSTRRRPRMASSPSFSASGWWREYKMQRAKKKFQVYMKKQGQDKGPWVN
jgi:membrane associated rhomboid family serine protease